MRKLNALDLWFHIIFCDLIFVFGFYIVINGIGLAVQAEHKQFMHVAIAAINAMFHKPSDAFWTGRAMDLIFDGINIDCSSKDPLVRIACKEIDRNGGATIIRANETTFKFSMLGGVSVWPLCGLHSI